MHISFSNVCFGMLFVFVVAAISNDTTIGNISSTNNDAISLGTPTSPGHSLTDFSVIGVRRELLQGPAPISSGSVIESYSTVYQDITTQLRAAILKAELDTAIALLVVSRDVQGLAAGLRYPPGQRAQYDIVTPERKTDPDVITIKALAGASLRLSDCGWKSSLTDDPTTTNPQVLGVLKIAQVAILTITPDSGVFPEGVNKFELQVNMTEAFANRTLMQQIVDDDPLQVSISHFSEE